MGYISIQINKAKGSAGMGASDRIERKTIPKNAALTRTHLNREQPRRKRKPHSWQSSVLFSVVVN